MFDARRYLREMDDFKTALEAYGAVYRYWLDFPGAVFSTERFIEFCANRGLTHAVTVAMPDTPDKYFEALQYVVDTRGEKIYHFTYMFDHANGRRATFCFEVEEEAITFRLRF